MKNRTYIQGIDQLMAGCSVCGKLNRIESFSDSEVTRCIRCGSKIRFRKKSSLSRTWALLIAALIFYIPANIYPMMYYSKLGSTQGDTIISGVISLLKADLWPLALIVFTASILVPLLKIVCLMMLLISVQYNWKSFYEERTKIYIFVEIIGKWSMLDIFLISLMTAIVKLGNIADVVPGEAIRYFAAVVILTLLAAMTFDPRTIWDKK